MKIKKIKKNVGKTIPTYDFEVKNKHHYLLDNGCVSHNTSSLIGSSASYLPVFNKYYNESMASMNVPFAPKFIKDRFWNYHEGWTIPTEKIIRMTAQIQKWVDTGLSMELIINPEITDIKKISDALLESFGNGLKAVYYSRTIQKNNNSDETKEVGCVSCAN